MAQKISYVASVSAWDEDRSNTETPRITPAKVSFKLSATQDANSSANIDVEGTSSTDFLMAYLPNNNASYVYTGKHEFRALGAKQGSFLIQGKGMYDMASMAATGTFDIIQGTGTEDLKDIKGSGSFGPLAPGSHEVRYNLEVEGVSIAS